MFYSYKKALPMRHFKSLHKNAEKTSLQSYKMSSTSHVFPFPLVSYSHLKESLGSRMTQNNTLTDSGKIKFLIYLAKSIEKSIGTKLKKGTTWSRNKERPVIPLSFLWSPVIPERMHSCL
jgi:hypothetical protein